LLPDNDIERLEELDKKIEQAKKRIKELEILIKLWEGKKIKLN